jgi:hypothetical protein
MAKSIDLLFRAPEHKNWPLSTANHPGTDTGQGLNSLVFGVAVSVNTQYT